MVMWAKIEIIQRPQGRLVGETRGGFYEKIFRFSDTCSSYHHRGISMGNQGYECKNGNAEVVHYEG